jgi:hypothetical protein
MSARTRGYRLATRLGALRVACFFLGIALVLASAPGGAGDPPKDKGEPGGRPASTASSEAQSASAVRSQKPGNDEQILLERARQYWEARVAHSRDVWSFYAPPEKGGPSRPKDVSEFGNVSYTRWEIEGATIDGERALVQVRVSASFPVAVQLEESFWTRTLREEWIKRDGTWYKKPVPLGFASPTQREAASRSSDADPGPLAEEGDDGESG